MPQATASHRADSLASCVPANGAGAWTNEPAGLRTTASRNEPEACSGQQLRGTNPRRAQDNSFAERTRGRRRQQLVQTSPTALTTASPNEPELKRNRFCENEPNPIR